jgi:nitrate reductase NapE component
MNCYYHQDHPAVGICKSCNKGVCYECAADIRNGLACKNSCEAEVKALNDLLERSKNAYQKTGKAYKRNALIHGLMGVAFLLWGILQVALTGEAGLAVLFVPFGLISLIASFFNIRNARQIARINP